MIQHMCMSIEGAIEHAKDLKGCVEVNGEPLNTVKEIRDYMRKQLLMGHRVLPMCRCSNFDYQRGCLGHEKREYWLTLKRIGLNNPTVVEYEGKELVTIGLGIDRLVKTWREQFGLGDCVIFLETDKHTIGMLSERTLPNVKSVKELFAEREVYFWEDEEAEK